MPRVYTSRFPDDVAGLVYGERTVLAEAPRSGHGTRRVSWRCSCSAEGVSQLWSVAQTDRCRSCAVARMRRPGRPARWELIELLVEARERYPEVWCGDEPGCVEAVAELVDLIGPMSLREIGALLGLSRERVRQIGRAALRHLEPRVRLADMELPDAAPPTWADVAELEGWEGVA